MHIDSGGMGFYQVTNVQGTWDTLEKMQKIFCDVASLLVPILALFATVPGTPEVFVRQAEGGVTVLSWKLTCKNGIIEKYMVTYFDVDDTSDDERLTTPETEKRIEKLRAGKTYEFQVGQTVSPSYSRNQFQVQLLLQHNDRKENSLTVDLFNTYGPSSSSSSSSSFTPSPLLCIITLSLCLNT